MERSQAINRINSELVSNVTETASVSIAAVNCTHLLVIEVKVPEDGRNLWVRVIIQRTFVFEINCMTQRCGRQL
jgi:hypothetical protein